MGDDQYNPHDKAPHRDPRAKKRKAWKRIAKYLTKNSQPVYGIDKDTGIPILDEHLIDNGLTAPVVYGTSDPYRNMAQKEANRKRRAEAKLIAKHMDTEYRHVPAKFHGVTGSKAKPVVYKYAICARLEDIGLFAQHGGKHRPADGIVGWGRRAWAFTYDREDWLLFKMRRDALDEMSYLANKIRYLDLNVMFVCRVEMVKGKPDHVEPPL